MSTVAAEVITTDAERHAASLRSWHATHGEKPGETGDKMLDRAAIAAGIDREPRLVWLGPGVQPPPSATGRRTSRWQPVIEMLRSRPGTWADLGAMRHAPAVLVKQRDVIEITTRRDSDDRKNGTFRVYARWRPLRNGK